MLLHACSFVIKVNGHKETHRACKIIGVDHVSVAQLYNNLSLKKTEQIINDSTHPLHQNFLKSNRSSGRLLQREIRTTRYSKYFVPTAIRLYNNQLAFS